MTGLKGCQVTASSYQNSTELPILTLNNSLLCQGSYQSPKIVKYPTEKIAKYEKPVHSLSLIASTFNPIHFLIFQISCQGSAAFLVAFTAL